MQNPKCDGFTTIVTINNIMKKKPNFYQAPECVLIEYSSEGVLCGSDKDSTGSANDFVTDDLTGTDFWN